MTTVHALSRRSIDQLEDAIIDHSKRLNATEYELLELVREFDIRQGWKAYHFNSCAEWLNLKCGIVVGTAREKVRVAMALFELPGISKSFAAGDLSYSKVRSLSRVATPHNEARLLDHALGATAEQVQTHCQRLRNADRRPSTTDANQIHRERYLSRSLDGSGRMTEVILYPRVTIADASMRERARELHHKAHELCFIANSVNFEVRYEDDVIV